MLAYELPEDVTEVPKHVGVLEDHILKCLQLVHLVGFIKEYY